MCCYASQPFLKFLNLLPVRSCYFLWVEEGRRAGTWALTVAAVLLDGVGGQLDGVLAGVLLREHQLLHLALCVQDCDLQDCGEGDGKTYVVGVSPIQGTGQPLLNPA